MGRAASNIALECALQTRPNVCLISEEVEARGMSLKQVCVYHGPVMVLDRNYGIDMEYIYSTSRPI